MSEILFKQGIPEAHLENPSRVLMRRVKDGTKFVVLLMEGSTPPNIGSEKQYPYVTLAKEERGMKYYQEVSAPVKDLSKPQMVTVDHTSDTVEVSSDVPKDLNSRESKILAFKLASDNLIGLYVDITKDDTKENAALYLEALITVGVVQAKGFSAIGERNKIKQL